jgi:hypothetical protein
VGSLARRLRLLLLAAAVAAPAGAQEEAPVRLTAGRFTFVSYPADAPLARSLLTAAQANDSFPGLPRPRQPVLVALAPDGDRFRQWIGPYAPEWGAAIAFPEARRVVMQGRRSGSDAGDPFAVLRHELAHLALHEAMGDLPPRWFDEGYAAYSAGEIDREEVLATNFALALRGVPTLDDLDGWFAAGERRAQTAYALSYRAVSDIAALDPKRGLSLFFVEWRARRTFDGALRAAYGTTLASFERAWTRRTRLRYGILALFADMTLGLVLFFALVFPLFWIRRRRDRRRMAALVAADEAAEEAARAGALEALLGSSGSAGSADSGGSPERQPPPKPWPGPGQSGS